MSLQISTRCINQAAVVKAAGYDIETTRRPGNVQRCLFSFPAIPETEKLLEAFEKRQPLPIPVKAILEARQELVHVSRRAVMMGDAL